MNVDELVHEAILENDSGQARMTIRKLAKEKGIILSSIYDFYQKIGAGKIQPHFTIPAINIRTLTYDTAQIVFELMKKHNIGPVIFEIARSEMEYTYQTPNDYTIAILAAAIKTDYSGPIFLQGDHFQLSAKKYKEDKEKEMQRIKDLIDNSLTAGFYNIDIDASTLVDLTKESLDEQQKENYTVTAELVRYIRNSSRLRSNNNPHPDPLPAEHREGKYGNVVSIGAEIGHIGGKNSTVTDLHAFMKGFLPLIDGITGISKMSVQTGTSHGGVVDALGKVEQVSLDFSVLESIGKVARNEYKLAGAVQHGASTLPLELFDKFPKNNCIEIHLATGFQNIVFDHMPKVLRDNMYAWVIENFSEEREPGQTDQQFLYKMRKKSLGPFKKQLWDLSESDKKPIMQTLEKQFEGIFEKLKIYNTKELLG